MPGTEPVIPTADPRDSAGGLEAGFALTAVVPCYDEAESIRAAYAEIVAELGRYDLELLFVDDGSTDGSLVMIRELAATDPRVQFLSFARNFGFEAAFSAGYRYASRPWVVHLDADLQFPPCEVHRLVVRARAGDDAVFGVRATRHDPWYRRWGAMAYHGLGRRLLGIEIPPGATTFRIVRTDVARRIVDLRLGTPYFLATLPRLTNRYSTVQVEHRARTRGRSKFRLGRLVAHALELYVAFSRRVIHGAALLALVAAMVAMAAAVAGAIGWLAAPGMAGVGLTLHCAGLLALAVLLRYLALVADDQPRPAMFYIREASIPIDPSDYLYAGQPAYPEVAS